MGGDRRDFGVGRDPLRRPPDQDAGGEDAARRDRRLSLRAARKEATLDQDVVGALPHDGATAKPMPMAIDARPSATTIPPTISEDKVPFAVVDSVDANGLAGS